MTIQDLYDLIATNETQAGSSDRITGAEVRGVDTALAAELLVRGIKAVANTATISATSGTDYRNLIVSGIGIFQWLPVGTPNGTTIFAASGGGVWSRVISVADPIPDDLPLTVGVEIAADLTEVVVAALENRRFRIFRNNTKMFDWTYKLNGLGVKIGFIIGASETATITDEKFLIEFY